MPGGRYRRNNGILGSRGFGTCTASLGFPDATKGILRFRQSRLGCVRRVEGLRTEFWFLKLFPRNLQKSQNFAKNWELKTRCLFSVFF